MTTQIDVFEDGTQVELGTSGIGGRGITQEQLDAALVIINSAIAGKQIDIGATALGALPAALAFGGTGIAGSSTAVARADHTHTVPTLASGGGGGIHTDNSRVGAVCVFHYSRLDTGTIGGDVTTNLTGFGWTAPNNTTRNISLPSGGTWNFIYTARWNSAIRHSASGSQAGGTQILSFPLSQGDGLGGSTTNVLSVIAFRIA